MRTAEESRRGARRTRPRASAHRREHDHRDVRAAGVHRAVPRGPSRPWTCGSIPRTRVRISQMLLDYHLDIALTEAPVSHEKIQTRALAHGPCSWRSRRRSIRSPRARRIPPSASWRSSCCCCASASRARGPSSSKGLAAAGVTPGRTMEIDGPEAIKQIAAAGRGIAIVSRYTVAEQLALGRLVVLDIPGLRITRPFYRLSLKQRRASPAAQGVRGAARRGGRCGGRRRPRAALRSAWRSGAPRSARNQPHATSAEHSPI